MKDPAFVQGLKAIPMPIKVPKLGEFSQYLAESYEAFGKYIDELG
jgi:hypothetical protein